MDTTQFVDEDGDGIDDRIGSLSALERFRQFMNSITAGIPKLPLPVPPERQAQVEPLLARIKATPNKWILPRTKRAVVDGYERAEPRADEWCRLAGVSKDEGALARMIASETGSLPPQYLLAVAEAVINESKVKNITPFQRITMEGIVLKGGKPAKSAGYFGRQSGRWCASIGDCTQRHLEAARVALSDHPKVARDARRWVDGKVMDRGLQGGKPLAYNAVTLVEKWGREGWEWIGHVYESDGMTLLFDPYILMLFRFVGKNANIERAVLAMKDGRRRWNVEA